MIPEPAPPAKKFFGHPRGLATLFFTEMWERFSYYGMRALLILFMVDAQNGGFGFDAQKAGAVYGLYVFGVYALALPGGWIADNIWGARKSVLVGGVLIALGHYCLALTLQPTFFIGLSLIVLGTGLLKPNVSAVVGDLYPGKDAMRDAGFSIFYMGINVGGLFGPLVCSWLGEPREGAAWVNWHYGFAAAGVGMTFAIIQYVAGRKHLAGAGELKEDAGQKERVSLAKKKFFKGVAVVAGAAVLIAVLTLTRLLPISLIGFARTTGVIVFLLSLFYFAYLIAFVCRDHVERRRVGLLAILFLGAALFWSGFEQAGSSMNLFAHDYTNRTLFGTQIPAGVLQSVNPLFIILLAPVFGMLWVKLGQKNPSIPVKFGLGLVFLGVGFLVLAWGSTYVAQGKVGMQWLVATYFLHTVGELCLSPVGLSSVTKLSPDRLVSQMMGTWFMGAALGNLIAGLVAGFIRELPLPNIFVFVAGFGIVSGLIFLIFNRRMNSLAAGIR